VTQAAVPGWRLVRVVFEGQPIEVAGVNPWDYQWRSTGGRIEVPHPSHPTQRHQLNVWQLDLDHGSPTFAAGELSNGVWCFYEPESAS
jgi:hypothetical protein